MVFDKALEALKALRPVCVDCERVLVPQREWRKMSPEQRAAATAAGKVKAATQKMCDTCYKRERVRRGPAPRDMSLTPLGRKTSHPERCGSCGKRMVSSSRWRLASKQERSELRAEGYVQHASRDLCNACRSKAMGYF